MGAHQVRLQVRTQVRRARSPRPVHRACSHSCLQLLVHCCLAVAAEARGTTNAASSRETRVLLMKDRRWAPKYRASASRVSRAAAVAEPPALRGGILVRESQRVELLSRETIWPALSRRRPRP